jgi:hypothetical protein
MPILLLEAPHFLCSIMPLEQHEQPIQCSCPATASLGRNAENVVAVVNQCSPHRFGQRNVELGRQRLRNATGGLVQEDRGSDGRVGHVVSIPGTRRVGMLVSHCATEARVLVWRSWKVSAREGAPGAIAQDGKAATTRIGDLGG